MLRVFRHALVAMKINSVFSSISSCIDTYFNSKMGKVCSMNLWNSFKTNSVVIQPLSIMASLKCSLSLDIIIPFLSSGDELSSNEMIMFLDKKYLSYIEYSVYSK